jgi:hypothetical protein
MPNTPPNKAVLSNSIINIRLLMVLPYGTRRLNYETNALLNIACMSAPLI